MNNCSSAIDEWVAYARQLHDDSNLLAGSFETQFTFAQALTESAKLANNCLLVISLPASDTSGSLHTQADDVEVGGVRGREALDHNCKTAYRLSIILFRASHSVFRLWSKQSRNAASSQSVFRGDTEINCFLVGGTKHGDG